MSRLLLWIAAQIITESFPVSSSSHVKFLEKIFSKMGDVHFLDRVPRHFEEFLHIPTLVIFILFFRSRWFPVLLHPWRTHAVVLPLVLRTLLASSITVAWYIFFSFVPLKQAFPVEIGLLITACMLFSLRYTAHSYVSYTWPLALVLGCVQGIALLPGISRRGSTYVAARWLNLSPRCALEASCAMYVPLLVAAGARSMQLLNVPVGLVMLLSSAVAYAGFWLVYRMSCRHQLWWFGYYVLLFALCYAVVTRY